jgi:ABC-type dipeptide/oligopeptide/nickel transport system permease component
LKLHVYIVRRVLLLAPVLLGVMTITFILVSAIPVGQRLESQFGQSKFGSGPTVLCSRFGLTPPNGSRFCPNPWYVNGIRELGLNQPVPVQWARYMYNLFTGQWGYTSAHSLLPTVGIPGGIPVITVLSWYLPYTLELAALSLLMIWFLSFPIGYRAAVKRNRPFDQGARLLSFSGFALPTFLLAGGLLLGAVLLTGGFTHICGGTATPWDLWYGLPPDPTGYACPPYNGVQPSWIGIYGQTLPTHFPTIDALIHGQPLIALDTIRRLLIPAFAVAFGSVAGILRFVRNSMLEVLSLDYIKHARSIGVPERQVIRLHAGRNAMNVTLTVLGLTFATFISGFPVIELIFGLRGIGLLFTYSVRPPYDFGVIFGTTIVFTIIVVSANLIVDVLYAYLDPRVRLG